MFFASFLILFVFCFNGCGGDKELSELVIGSWTTHGNSSLINVDRTVDTIFHLKPMESVLTFGSGGRFDFVVTVNVLTEFKDTLGNDVVSDYGVVKIVVAGSYDVYGSTVLFHCDKSISNVIVYSGSRFGDMFSSVQEELENKFSSTLDVFVSDDILNISSTRWKRK